MATLGDRIECAFKTAETQALGGNAAFPDNLRQAGRDDLAIEIEQAWQETTK